MGGPTETSVEHKLILVTGNVSSGQAKEWYRDLLFPFLCFNTVVLSGTYLKSRIKDKDILKMP